jgi:D-3-phosphoglycerate dehydrogenase
MLPEALEVASSQEGCMRMIVISEMMDERGINRLAEQAEVHYDPHLFHTPAELSRRIAGAMALIVRNQTQVSAELMASAPQLKVVGRLGVGLDNIDIEAARRRGVPVVSAQGANAVAVAEYVFACLLRWARNLDAVAKTVTAGQWDRTLGGSELFGKTLGLVGVGDIASRVAFRANSFGMEVVAYDPWQLATRFTAMELGVRLLGLPTVLQSADFISVHVPLTQETRHLINAETLGQMKASAYLINTSRGGVVDEVALASALATGRLRGAALDVRDQEPPGATDPLRALDSVITTPHIAGLTEEAGYRTALTVAEDVLRVLAGRRPLAAV